MVAASSSIKIVKPSTCKSRSLAVSSNFLAANVSILTSAASAAAASSLSVFPIPKTLAPAFLINENNPIIMIVV